MNDEFLFAAAQERPDPATPRSRGEADMAKARGFLKIDGVSGVSTDPAHLNSIELLSWGWGNHGSMLASNVGNTVRPSELLLHFSTEDTHAAHQMFVAESKGTEFKDAQFDIVGPEVGVLQVVFKGVTITGSVFRPTREGAVYWASLFIESGKPVPVGPAAQNVMPVHAGMIHEVLHGRSRPGGK